MFLSHIDVSLSRAQSRSRSLSPRPSVPPFFSLSKSKNMSSGEDKNKNKKECPESQGPCSLDMEARTQLRWGLRLPVLMLGHFGNALHRVAVLEVGPEGLRALLLSGRHMGMTTLGSQRKDTGKLGVKVQGGAPKWSPK